MSLSPKLSELGETGLIELLTRDLAADMAGVIRGVGDDAAVLRVSGSDWLLLTTDMLVEEIHFSLSYAAPEQVGVRAMAANVSDIAAMGGWPAYAVVSLGVPAHISVEVMEGIYAGLRKIAGIYKISIVGGDTVKSPERLVINVALLGWIEAERAVYRSGARPGDLVFVTGTLGNSAAGLYLCQNPHTIVLPETSSFLMSAHLEPGARIEAGRFLAGTGKISSMDDISDGLATELHQICRASGVGCRIRAAAVPMDSRMKAMAAACGNDPLDWALYGGEDFELVFTVSPEYAPIIKGGLEEIGEQCYRVGEIVAAEEGISMELQEGCFLPLQAKGYDHFKSTFRVI